MSDSRVKQRVCAVLHCGRRGDLIPTKTILLGKLLATVDLCPQHEAEHTAGVHETFRGHFGVDFFDAERN